MTTKSQLQMASNTLPTLELGVPTPFQRPSQRGGNGVPTPSNGMCPNPLIPPGVGTPPGRPRGGLGALPRRTTSKFENKRCQTCKERKGHHEFAGHNGSRDGRRNHCRECLLSGRYQPYIEPPDVRALRKVRQSKPKWRRSHRRALQRHAERNPVQAAAQKALKAAVRAGRIEKAKHCQARGCTSALSIEAHHWSYAREHWLDVLWCCAAHHRQGHAQGFIVPADGTPAHYGTVPEMAATEVEAAS
jgi:hypothetical protein